jgi:hypothetical protein
MTLFCYSRYTILMSIVIKVILPSVIWLNAAASVSFKMQNLMLNVEIWKNDFISNKKSFIFITFCSKVTHPAIA